VFPPWPANVTAHPHLAGTVLPPLPPPHVATTLSPSGAEDFPTPVPPAVVFLLLLLFQIPLVQMLLILFWTLKSISLWTLTKKWHFWKNVVNHAPSMIDIEKMKQFQKVVKNNMVFFVSQFKKYYYCHACTQKHNLRQAQILLSRWLQEGAWGETEKTGKVFCSPGKVFCMKNSLLI